MKFAAIMIAAAGVAEAGPSVAERTQMTFGKVTAGRVWGKLRDCENSKDGTEGGAWPR